MVALQKLAIARDDLHQYIDENPQKGSPTEQPKQFLPPQPMILGI